MPQNQPRDYKAEAEERRKLQDITRQIVAGHRAAKGSKKEATPGRAG